MSSLRASHIAPRHNHRSAAAGVLISVFCGVSGVHAQTIDYCNTVNIPTAAVDQNGVAFTVAELSGAAWLGPDVQGGNRYACVVDGSNKVVLMDVVPDASGCIQSITIVRGLSLAQTFDLEGIVYDPSSGNIFIAEEDTPAIREFSLTSGALLRTLTTPNIYLTRRANLGFESLALSADALTLWTANEEALQIDGPVSTQSAGTLVRLQRYYRSNVTLPFTPGFQCAYRTQPIHGIPTTGSRSGVSELTFLPDGTLIALERSLAFSPQGLYLSRFYSVNTAAATDTRTLTTVTGSGVITAIKDLKFTGSFNNLEGLTVGPLLSTTGPVRVYFMLGVLDDGDPVTTNQAIGFSVTITGCIADYNQDGGIDGSDVDVFFADWINGLPAADANADGGVDGADVSTFFTAWSAGGC
jgi:hypothetical protein